MFLQQPVQLVPITTKVHHRFLVGFVMLDLLLVLLVEETVVP
jgi:hypothetical protein